MDKNEEVSEALSEKSQLVILCIAMLVFIATAVYGGFYINFILIYVAAGIVCGGFMLAYRKTNKNLFLILYGISFIIAVTKLENIDFGFTHEWWSIIQELSILTFTVLAIGFAYTVYLRHADAENDR